MVSLASLIGTQRFEDGSALLQGWFGAVDDVTDLRVDTCGREDDVTGLAVGRHLRVDVHRWIGHEIGAQFLPHGSRCSHSCGHSIHPIEPNQLFLLLYATYGDC